nr:tetratricopeptide repeat protein [candidate division Zixibacteria bacterium]
MIPFTLFSQDIKQEIIKALESGDTTGAIGLLENDIKLDPSYEYNYLTLGNIYFNQGKYKQAEEQFQISVDKKRNFYEGLYALSLVQMKLNKLKDAEENLKRGLKKAKDMKADFHNGMGLLYMAQGKYNDADAEFRKAIILDSKKAEYHVNLGDDNYMMGVYSLAINEYEQALELDTAGMDVYFHWAEACLELKDYSCALEKLNIVLQKDSTHAPAWMKAGGIYYKAARSSRTVVEAMDHYKAAIGAYKKFFEISSAAPDSSNGRAFYESGMAYLMIGGYPEAISNFKTILAIPVEPKDIYFYMGRAYQGNEQYDSALVYFNKHIEWVKKQGEDYRTGVKDDELYRRIGECYQAQKDYYNTITYFKKSLEYDSTQDRLLYGVAVAYNYLQDYRNALIYYMKRIDLGADDKYWSLYYNAAMSALYLLDKGGAAMAEEEEDLGLDEGRPTEPANDPLADVDLARLAVQYLEKVAVEYWDKVTENPDNMPTAMKALSMLGTTYLFQLKDCANGVKHLERVLEIDPNNCEALRSLGYAYFGGICPNNYSRALTYLKKALDCSSAAKGSLCADVDVLLWIAQTYEFRAIEKAEAKQKEESKQDYKAAHDGYLETLKCDPGNKEAVEGERRTKFSY